MSSFLKTSFIHDETDPSESLVLLLKRSFSRQHHLHFFLVFSVPRPSALIVCFALGLQRCTRGRPGLLQATSWWGHVRPCPCPGALCEGWTGWAPAYGRSPRGLSWYSGVWAVTEPDVCARSELRKFLRNQWGLFIKMATDWHWQVSEVGDTCRAAAGPGRRRSVQIEWLSAGTAHLGFSALLSPTCFPAK